VPAAGLPPGRTLNFTVGANTVPVTAPVGGYTGAQLATALAAAINANAGMAAVVTAGNVAGNTFTVTADVAGTPFTGSLSGNGSGQIDTVSIPSALGAADTLSASVAGGGPFNVAGPSTVAAARTSLITQINAAALGVTAVADPNDASKILIQSDTAGGTFTAAADGGGTVTAAVTTDVPAAEVNTTANVTPVAQVDTVTLGGTVGPGEIGDTWSITIGTTTVSYVNDGTETSLADIATGFAAKINEASGLPVTASVSGSQIVLTAETPGTPFAETLTATNGNVPGFVDIHFGETAATAGTITQISNQYNPSGDATVPATQNAGDPAVISFTVDYGSGPQVVELDLGKFQTTDGLTQFSGTQVDIQRLSQDGLPQGLFTGINISENGDVELNYDNGKSQVLYRVPLAQFYDPTALKRENGQAFTETFDSGTARITNPGASGAGTVRSSAVEGSNVDIAEEFSKMIVTQRAYAANARVITTADDMLQEVINIKR
jgi:flagellar hook protein FlgE